MINPNNDRLDYGKLLAPPDKYKLDYAIGTTYSLDLEALVGASLALGLGEELDGGVANNPIALLENLRETSEKISLFCEAGQIHLPQKSPSFYLFLDKIVNQVMLLRRGKKSAYPSFHPKIWLIRYVGDHGEPYYRLIVLSRNLTFDRSWDISFCLDGRVTNEQTDKNQPLKDLLAYLHNNEKNGAKKRKIKEISGELSQVHFELNNKLFNDFEFIPVGISRGEKSKYSIEDYPLFNETFHELFIMSPFLSDDVIEKFNRDKRGLTGARRVLITRATSLPRLKAENCNNFEIYTLKDEVIDGEWINSVEQNGEYRKQDIHAKIFMRRKDGKTELYIGSLNASNNAINGNIE
ncbi:MAG: phospholipase D family protein, partial [Clostridia bacterium]|nr:phospholipase D family protein [Clostridia bacterium]